MAVVNRVCEGCSLTLFDIVRQSEDGVVEILITHGVLRGESDCLKCGDKLFLDKKKLTFRCCKSFVLGHKKRRRCSYIKSARTNTFLSGTHISTRVILEICACFLHLKPPRQQLIMNNCGVSSGTVVDWYSYVREVYIDHQHRQSELLGGPGCTVEIDEAKFGKRKYNRGRRVEGQWVFGGIERDSRKSFLVPVESRDADTLLGILKEWVRPGTTVISDCWKAYNCLDLEGFQHLTVNHSLNFVDPDTGAHTNTVERAWRDARSTIPRYGVRKVHFAGYLAEYQFKRKYPAMNERLHHFLLAAANLYPPP